MILILMRHGVAADRATWRGDDALRPLTKIGKTKTRCAARGLSTLVPEVALIASSPLLRALQTAHIAREFYPQARLEIWDELTRAEYSALRARLQNLSQELPRDAPPVLLVGHEPGLSTFAARLCDDEKSFRAGFKKAGACALEFESDFDDECDGDLHASPARLVWRCAPKVLRAL